VLVAGLPAALRRAAGMLAAGLGPAAAGGSTGSAGLDATGGAVQLLAQVAAAASAQAGLSPERAAALAIAGVPAALAAALAATYDGTSASIPSISDLGAARKSSAVAVDKEGEESWGDGSSNAARLDALCDLANAVCEAVLDILEEASAAAAVAAGYSVPLDVETAGTVLPEALHAASAAGVEAAAVAVSLHAARAAFALRPRPTKQPPPAASPPSSSLSPPSLPPAAAAKRSRARRAASHSVAVDWAEELRARLDLPRRLLKRAAHGGPVAARPASSAAVDAKTKGEAADDPPAAAAAARAASWFAYGRGGLAREDGATERLGECLAGLVAVLAALRARVLAVACAVGDFHGLGALAAAVVAATAAPDDSGSGDGGSGDISAAFDSEFGSPTAWGRLVGRTRGERERERDKAN